MLPLGIICREMKSYLSSVPPTRQSIDMHSRASKSSGRLPKLPGGGRLWRVPHEPS